MKVGSPKHGKKSLEFTWKGNKTMAIMTTIVLAGAGVYGYEKAHKMVGRKKQFDK